MIEIWADGACIPNPGVGGWAWVSKCGKNESGKIQRSTNNEMEAIAVLMALRYWKNRDPDIKITIYSDSTYVVNTMTAWLPTRLWEGWDGFKHSDVFKEIYALSKNVTFKWVKGHSGDFMNDKADKLSVNAAYTARTHLGQNRRLLEMAYGA